MISIKFLFIFCRILLDSEKAEVESHKQLLCLDNDVDVLYDLLEKTKKFMTKGKAKELMKYTVNLDTNLRRSVAIGRSCLFRASDAIPQQKHPASISKRKSQKATKITEVENGEIVTDSSDGRADSKNVSFLDENSKLSISQPLVVQISDKKKELPMPAGEYLQLMLGSTSKNIHKKSK